MPRRNFKLGGLMAFKEQWTNKIDGVDDLVAEDINMVAQAIIDLEQKLGYYMDGTLTASMFVANHLGVLESGDFEGLVNIVEPIADSNPATKKYVDDLFANIKLAEDGEY